MGSKRSENRRRPVVLATAVVAAVVAATVGPASLATAATPSPPVFGYQAESDPTSLIDASAAALGGVGVDGVNITGSGAGVTTPDAAARAQLARAHALGKKAELLVGNYSDPLQDFDEPAAHRLLSSAKNRTAVAARLGDAVRSQGWDGVDVDLESLTARDTPGLVAFLRAVRSALPAGTTVSVAVTAYETLDEYSAGGYDLWSIGQVVDRVVLMAYDHHGFGDSGPGPIGDLPWQAEALDIVLGEVAAPKVDLGVAGYGYRWAKNGDVSQLSDAEARAAAGSLARYDGTAHEWTARLSDGSILWWSDARSLVDRRPLVRDRGVHGLAVWVLGLSDTVQP